MGNINYLLMIKNVKKTEVTREYTINLHKRCHKIAFKKKAPKAIKMIIKFAKKVMQTDIVKIHTDLNKYIWSKGIRNIPRRVRIKIQRKLNEDEDQEGFISHVYHVNVPKNF